MSQLLLPWNTPSGHPWRWEENNTVLVWEDGTTLAFLDEIEAMSRYTTQHRLPSLTCVALILAGCRGKAPALQWLKDQGFPDALLQEADNLLRGLQAFPADTLTIAGKAAIIDMVADAQRLTRYVVAHAIADWRDHTEAEIVVGLKEPAACTALRVAKALRDITPDAVRARLKTGLDDAVSAAGLPDLELTDSVRQLLALLKDDAELSGIAALARDVLAALTFPRRPEEDADVPEGGFSDLTNRGSPDRLLLSELAADPLMLAVRVSLNEALYLRRETPRKSKPRAVAVLVDTSLRMWGLPRPFAWAVALALLAKQEGAAELALWCVDYAAVSRLRIATREDVLTALARLDAGADPVPALSHFFEAAREWQRQKEAPADTDFFFITHPDTLLEPGFWRLAEDWPPLHLALVNQEGEFTLEQRTRSTRRELARARLKLDSILGAPAARTATTGPRDPLILRHHPFPLRVSARGRVLKTCGAGMQAWCAITEPRQWVYWKAGWPGGVLLAHRLPKGRVVWVDFEEPFTAYALFQEDDDSLTLVRSGHGGVAEFTLPFKARVLHAHLIGSALFVLSASSLATFSVEDGQCISATQGIFHPKEKDPTFCGRFFRNLFLWHTLTWDGSKADYHRLLWDTPHGIVLAFTSSQGEACALTRNGTIHSFATEPSTVIGQLRRHGGVPDFHSAELNSDGTRLLATCTDGHQVGWIFSSKQSVSFERGRRTSQWLEIAAPPCSTSFVNVTCVGFTEKLKLAIQLNGKQWLRLTHDKPNIFTWRTPAAFELSQSSIVVVERPERTSTSRAWRGEATWPSGAQLLVDDHGIIHLLPPSPDDGEIALTTGSGRVGIWTTDGCCGPTELLSSGGEASPAWGVAADAALAQFINLALGH